MLTSRSIDQNFQSVNSLKKILVAYSGGLDSHVLLHLVSGLENYDIRAMHIHHGLLADADAWVKHCEKICSDLNIPLETEYLGLTIKKGESLEDIARTARYKALKASLQQDEMLLTAHHQNDQTETLLLQLFRGAGVNGLAAMPKILDINKADDSPLQKGIKRGMCALGDSLPSSLHGSLYKKSKHIRPLLNESRQSLESYAEKHQLEYIEDPSNLDTTFDRNFLRNEVLPLLRSRWQGLDKSISRSASIQAETKQLLDELAAQDLINVQSSDALSIKLSKLLELSLARQKLLIRYWIKHCGFISPSEKKLKHIFSDVINAQEDAQPLVAWSAKGDDAGAELRRFNNKLTLMKPLSKHDSSQVFTWDIDKPLEIKSLQLLLDFQSLNIDSGLLQDKNNSVTVRFRQGGEKFFMPKRGAHISLKNLMHESKVPPWQRSRLPLLYVGENLVKIIGLTDSKTIKGQ